MQVYRLPALSDNYIFLLHDPEQNIAAVVDPAEAEPVLRQLQALNAQLVAIFNTHHHGDHVGGNSQLIKRFPGVCVYGGAEDAGRIPGQQVFLTEGARVEFAGKVAEVFFVPGHTRAHIAYYFPPDAPIQGRGEAENGRRGERIQTGIETPPEFERLKSSISVGVSDPWDLRPRVPASPRPRVFFDEPGDLFCGDTLFAGGCGRLFEGTPAQMVASLTKLRDLPDNTRVWCAHEYTLKNLEFAITVDGVNPDLQQRYAEVKAARDRSEATVPSILGVEKRTNPFLRWDVPELQAAAKSSDRIQTFARIRGMKDRF